MSVVFFFVLQALAAATSVSMGKGRPVAEIMIKIEKLTNILFYASLPETAYLVVSWQLLGLSVQLTT